MKTFTVFIINLILVCILLLLQFLKYAFAPAVNPNSKNIEFETRQALIEINMTLIVESIIGIIIVFFLNKIILGKEKLITNFMLIIINIMVISISLYFYSTKYYYNFVYR